MPESSFDPEHPDLGWQPAIPEPYWVRRWLRKKPACWPCYASGYTWWRGADLLVFPDREAYGKHWLQKHARWADG